MASYDIFNGDADGICALVQLRLEQPKPGAILITGVKRNINLLSQITVQPGDDITVLDVSLDKNRAGLEQALSAEATIYYADHHFAGDIPEHNNLTAEINTSADVCTAMIVNARLKDKYINWAITGAFGDNLNVSATALASRAGLSDEQCTALKRLGILINYNGYGASLDDLHFNPADLYSTLVNYLDPLDFCSSGNETYTKLSDGYDQDLANANALSPHFESSRCRVYLLPNHSWARRVSGVYSNQLANESPALAHAVLTEKSNGNYLVSIRAPLNNKTGADEFCRQFPTGGGRAAAAGINDLDSNSLEQMIIDFDKFYNI